MRMFYDCCLIRLGLCVAFFVEDRLATLPLRFQLVQLEEKSMAQLQALLKICPNAFTCGEQAFLLASVTMF